MQAWTPASARAGGRAGEHAQPRAARSARATAKRGAGADEHAALGAEVDHARPLGDRLAEGGVEDRRAAARPRRRARPDEAHQPPPSGVAASAAPSTASRTTAIRMLTAVAGQVRRRAAGVAGRRRSRRAGSAAASMLERLVAGRASSPGSRCSRRSRRCPGAAAPSMPVNWTMPARPASAPPTSIALEHAGAPTGRPGAPGRLGVAADHARSRKPHAGVAQDRRTRRRRHDARSGCPTCSLCRPQIGQLSRRSGNCGRDGPGWSRRRPSTGP